ncbi:hypothetical protein ABZW30_38620 [Kitasatospora sp. NPDC004669]|uniref:hypothetical protein n=1 Tax=Kitasatospora sp. NPDC004669 TaxID=3154555 RepID=UPI0033AD9F0E
MSGSPKYSTVQVASVYARREQELRRRREAERRRQQEQRARERADLAVRRARERAELAVRRAQEAAARRERARAEVERARQEAARRRAAEREAHTRRMDQEQAGADARGLAEVRRLLERARQSRPGSELDALEAELARLQQRVGGGGGGRLGAAIEELRGRIVSLPGSSTAGGDRAALLAGFEERLAALGPDAAAHDAEGRQRCTGLLDRLRAESGPGAQTRVAALLGTVEHALTRHAATVADQRRAESEAAEARRRAQEQAEEARLQAAEEARRQAAEQAAARVAAEEAERERLAALLGEASDRLGVVRPAVTDAAAEARDLADPELADRLDRALHSAEAVLATPAPDAALDAVAALEAVLAEAETRLDELHLAHTRRTDLAQALQDAMLGEGFAFLGGGDHGDALVLRFERATGALYETTVATGDDGSPVLVYQVEGEPDVALHPDPQRAVCDATEDLLERVHEVIGEQEEFVPGELTWDGKPPRTQSRPLPNTVEWRWQQ